MEHDFMKRGYLLPEGCKNLIDVLEKSKEPPEHPVLFLELPRLQKPLLFKFNPTKPFWKPSA
jgi:hypothetical protein